jgi:hypothetical protein
VIAPAIIAPSEDFGRCTCPTCKRLDAKHPGEGYQLALFRYFVSVRSAVIGR